MKNLYKKIASIPRQAISLFFVNLAILSVILCFSGNNYSIDSYGIELNGYEENAVTFIGSYRFFGAFISYIFSILGHNPVTNCTVDTIFFIAIISVIITVFALRFIKLLESKSLLNIFIIDSAVLICILNVWFCNILSFPECVFMSAIGLLFVFSAITLFTKSQSILNCIICSILIICATGIYQQFLAMTAVFMLAFCCFKISKTEEKDIKSIIKVFVKPALIILISGIVYAAIAFGLVALLGIKGNERVALSIESIISNILYYINKQHSYLKGRAYFESELLTLSFLAVIAIWCGVIIYRMFKLKEVKKSIFSVIAVAGAYFFAYFPGLISTSNGVRTVFVLFSMFFVFTLGTLSLTQNKKIKICLAVILAVVLSMNIIRIVECEMNLKSLNAKDNMWAKTIVNEIDTYEKQSNKKINFIAFCEDENVSGNNHGVFNYTQSVLTVGYAKKSIIPLHMPDRQLEFVETPDEIYNKYFSGKNWDSFVPSEQLVFLDNTLYICCY